MNTELVLKTGPYRTTYVGTEIIRQSTKEEWENYGEILRRVDEAKQWAIGDWLVDGKRHYGDGLYKQAENLLGIGYNELARFKRIAEQFEIRQRCLNLSYAHHYEVASLKRIEEKEDGTLELSEQTDTEKIQKFLSDAEKENISVRELREKVRKYKEEQREYIRLANEPEKYTVIYADPPWQYTSGDQHTDTTQETVIGDHYPSMSLQEIRMVPVNKMAAIDCVLFLWVTSPLLEESFEIIRAWGFKYKTSMVWDKIAHNVGNFVSVRHEFLLICIKGQPPRVSTLVDSVYQEERTEHSKKPIYFRNLIDELYPNGKRIELFARGELPENWDKWGNE